VTTLEEWAAGCRLRDREIGLRVGELARPSVVGASGAERARRVRLGIEACLERPGSLADGRVALLAHAASTLADGTHVLDALLGAGLDVACVLGPEHGFRGSAPPGRSECADIDVRSGVPILDVYRMGPDVLAARLASRGIQRILVDVQDVGCRFYTYVSTVCDLLLAAGSLGIPVTVADRPNPLGGEQIGGPTLEPAFRSFVGRLPVPVRHGLTLGELALLATRGLKIPVDLDVRVLEGWRRPMLFEDTGLPWVPPSPNLPTPDAALCYPGIGFVEGTTLSEGRGTPRPFQFVGFPGADGGWAEEVRALRLDGVVVTEAHLTPTAGPFAGREVVGVGIHVVDPRELDPLRLGLELLASARRRFGEAIGFRPDHFDLLAGTDRLRRGLMADIAPVALLAEETRSLEEYRERRCRSLLYPS